MTTADRLFAALSNAACAAEERGLARLSLGVTVGTAAAAFGTTSPLRVLAHWLRDHQAEAATLAAEVAKALGLGGEARAEGPAPPPGLSLDREAAAGLLAGGPAVARRGPRVRRPSPEDLRETVAAVREGGGRVGLDGVPAADGGLLAVPVILPGITTGAPEKLLVHPLRRNGPAILARKPDGEIVTIGRHMVHPDHRAALDRALPPEPGGGFSFDAWAGQTDPWTGEKIPGEAEPPPFFAKLGEADPDHPGEIGIPGEAPPA